MIFRILIKMIASGANMSRDLRIMFIGYKQRFWNSRMSIIFIGDNASGGTKKIF